MERKKPPTLLPFYALSDLYNSNFATMQLSQKIFHDRDPHSVVTNPCVSNITTKLN